MLKFDYNGCQRTVSTNAPDRGARSTARSGRFRTAQTILQLLESLALDPARVAVELDRRIVKPHDWGTTPIAEGAHLEIVQFVGGG